MNKANVLSLMWTLFLVNYWVINWISAINCPENKLILLIKWNRLASHTNHHNLLIKLTVHCISLASYKQCAANFICSKFAAIETSQHTHLKEHKQKHFQSLFAHCYDVFSPINGSGEGRLPWILALISGTMSRRGFVIEIKVLQNNFDVKI